MPRIPRQQGDGKEQVSPPIATTVTPPAEEEAPQVGIPEMGAEEERRLLEEPEAGEGITDATSMEVGIGVEEEAALLTAQEGATPR